MAMVPPASSLPGTSETAVYEEVKGDGICVQPAAITRKKIFTDNQPGQYCKAGHCGVLQQYFQKIRPSAQLHFENRREERGFMSTCRVDEVLDVGRAQTKKHAIQLPALDVVSKMGLAPPAGRKSARRFPRNHPDLGTNAIAPICRNDQYRRNNFRGALLEHFQKLGKEVNIAFETAPELQGRFISKCSYNGIVCKGRAGSKKRAIQLAAFDLLCKLKLLPSDEIERQRERQRKQKDICKFGTQSQNMLQSQRTPLIVPSEQLGANDLLKVLELHFKKIGKKVVLSFKTIMKTNKSFFSTCVIDGVKGSGRGCTEKQAIQHAALDLIVKLKVPLQENVKRMHQCKRESRKRSRVWRSAGLLYILHTTKAKELAKNFGVKQQTKTGYRCLLPVPLSNLLDGGHERCRPFKCVPDLCQIRTWMIDNIPKKIMAEFRTNKISAGFPGLFFTRLSEKKLLARLSKVRETHSAICGLETHRNSSRSRGSRIVNMSFTGWGKREERDKDAMDTARRETLEECGIDIDKVSWDVKLQRISFGEPLYIFIDMNRATSLAAQK